MSRSVEEAIDAVAQQVLLDAMGRCNQGNPQQQFRGYKKGDRSWLRDAHERSLEDRHCKMKRTSTCISTEIGWPFK